MAVQQTALASVEFQPVGRDISITVRDDVTRKEVARTVRLGSVPQDGRALALALAADELLRYVSPVRYFGRVATRATEIGGQLIRRGEAVLPYFSAANRDPDVYTDPHRFDVGRLMESTPHVAFSSGVHFCAGRAPRPARDDPRLRRAAAAGPAHLARR